MPLSLLFPNLLSNYGEDVSMISIFKVVISIAFLSLKRIYILKENIDTSENVVKLQRQFLGFDLTNVFKRSHSVDNLLRDPKYDEEASTTIFSDSEVKVSGPHFKISDSLNNSFDINNSGKVNSSDDETSGQDSCSSLKTAGNDKNSLTDLQRAGMKPLNVSQGVRLKQNKGNNSIFFNEAYLPKVNWMIGFEEASSKNLFDCLWI